MQRFMLVLVLSISCAGAIAQAGDEPTWPLAVRIMSYGDFQEAAWEHLPAIGVKYLFMSVPKDEEVQATQQKLKDHGLTPLVFRGSADLSKDSFVEELTPQLAVCQQMGVHYMFLSAKRGDAPKEVAYERLRAAGDVAKKYGVTITLETHPDLGTNGDVQVETMKAIDHPNVRVNFDSANITYYNANTTALDELKKSVAYVATVEFKDHTGGLETWDFPVLGQGKVDFSKIVETLRAADYQGPVTLEFEGTKGVTLTKEQTLQAIADSVAYARTIANFE